MNIKLRIHLFVVMAVSFTIFCSCSNSGKLTKRYDSIKYVPNYGDSIKYYVAVNGYVFNPEEPKDAPPKTIFNLSPKGQKEMIKVLSTKETKSDDFLKKLSTNILKEKKEKTDVVNNTKFTKRLVFSVRDLSPGPADRIAKIMITVHIEDARIQVISFDKIITNYSTVDLGKLDFTNTTNLGVSANVGLGAEAAGDTSLTTATIPQAGFGYGINANASNSRTFAEEVMLKQRYVSLSGYVTPKSINIYEESVSGVDLTGNIAVEFTAKYVNNDASKVMYKFSNLKKDNVYTKPDSLDITEEFIYYPNLDSDISLTYEYQATERQVSGGDKTISESDDKIIMYDGKTRGDEAITLVPFADIKPKLWVIAVGKDYLSINSPVASPSGILYFDSYDEAKDFIFWLKGSTALIGTGAMNYGRYKLVSPQPDLIDFIKKSSISIVN